MPAGLSSLCFIFAAVLVAAAAGYWAIRRGKQPADSAQIDEKRRMLLKADRRAITPAPPAVEEWKPARDAVEAYADPELIRVRDVWIQRSETASQKEAEARQQIKEILARFPDGEVPSDSDARKELDAAERLQRAKAMVLMNSQEEVRQLRIDIHADVYKKLCLGTLHAKGVREPRAERDPEVRIHPAEWRDLMLHHLDGKAVQRGIDGKLVYSGLVIGKPKG